MIRRLRIAHLRRAERRLRQCHFQTQDGLRRVRCLRRIPARQLEHAGDIFLVLLARLHKSCLFPHVIIFFRKRKPGCGHIHQHHRRVVWILPAAQIEGRGYANIVQFKNNRLQRRHVVGPIDLRQPWFQRLQSTHVDASLVSASGVEIANQLRRTSLGSVLRLFRFLQNGAQFVFAGFARLPPLAPPRHRRWNRIIRPPCAIGILIKVRAWINFSIDIAQVHPVQLGGLGEQQRATKEDHAQTFKDSHRLFPKTHRV